MSECPPKEYLRQFLAGQLAGAMEEWLCAHIEECSACQVEMSRLVEDVADPQWSAVRDTGLAPGPEVEKFLAQLKKSLPSAAWEISSWKPAERSESSSPPVRPSAPLSAGTPVIPGYDVLEELGRGGMGVVYKARQVGLDRLVALKTLPIGKQASLEELARFRTEAEAAAALQHEHIVRVYDVGEYTGTPFFAMELVTGGSLRDNLDGRCLPPRQAASLIETLARAAHHAHSRGIIHRDLKPGNILLQKSEVRSQESLVGSERSLSSDPRPLTSDLRSLTTDFCPKIADFGLARRLGDLRQTRHGEVLGTPSYMAPEQASGKRIRLGPTVDVYALGAVLYELLSGRPPFLGKSWESTLACVLREEPIPPRRLQPKCPRDLETICLKCLEKEPARRYGSALELADDLGRYQNGEPVRARPPSLVDQWMKFAGRNQPLVAGVLGTGIAVLIGAIVSVAYAIGEARQRKLADANSQQAEAASQKASQEAYQARIAAAFLALGEGESSDARRHVEAAPEALRGWEWRYLQARLLDKEPVALHMPADYTFVAPLLSSGRHILAYGGPKKRCAILDARSGELLQELPDASSVWATETPAGTNLVVYKTGSPLCLIDPSGIVRKTPTTFPASAYAMALSPRGDRLAVAWRDGNSAAHLEVRELPSGKPILQFPDSADPFNMAFSPDGALLAVACADSGIRVWDAATGHSRGVLRGHTGRVECILFSPDGRRLLSTGDDTTVRQWDVVTGLPIDVRLGHNQWTMVAAYSPDGQWFLTGSEDRTARLWRSSGGPPVAVLRGHASGVGGVAFHPDGATLVSVDRAGGVYFWPSPIVDDSQKLKGHTSYVYPVVYGPDGTWLASGGWDDVIRLWDAASGEPITALRGPQGYVAALAISPDGKRLASLSRDEHLRIWDVATGKLQANIPDFSPIQGEPQTLAISPDGAVVACGSHNRVRMWDLATGREAAGFKLPVERDIRLAVFHPNNQLLAVAAAEPVIYLVNRASGAIVRTLSGHTAPIQAISFSRDGRRLVSAGNDRTVRLWDTDTGILQQTLHGHTEQIFAVAFHPDGTRVASGGRDRAIRIWETTTGNELARLTGHTDYVFSLAFSPDGSTLASGSGDFTVRLWETRPLTNRRAALDNLHMIQPEANLLVERLFKEESDAVRVMQRVSLDGELSQNLRRASWFAVLRRETDAGSPNAKQER